MKRVSTRSVLVAGLLVALLLAGFVSFYASSDPDGLNRVAQDKGFADTEEDHGPPTARSPATRPRASTTAGSPAGSPASSARWSC